MVEGSRAPYIPDHHGPHRRPRPARGKPLTADYVLIAITTLALARGGFKFGGWADTLLRR
ncbi:MAG TPA: hypothetical protein VGI28_08105 [Stellaceae bacterium]|jgi:hypothetical protein